MSDSRYLTSNYAVIEARIEKMVGAVESHGDAMFWPLSTGEKIAVALVLDRVDLLMEDGWTDSMKPAGTCSVLLAIERLGEDWFTAAMRVRRRR